MHNVHQAIYYDQLCRSVVVYQSVYRSVCHATALCNTAEQIEVLFGVETLGDPRHILLDGASDPPSASEGKGEILLVVKHRDNCC